jgi:hypothetical protein
MEYLAYATVTLVLLYTLGIGFTLLLLPKEFQRYCLLIAPWVGYSYAVVASWQIYFFGARLGGIALLLILLLPVAGAAGILLRQGKTVLSAIFSDGPVLGGLAISAAVFLILSLPVLSSGQGLTTLSLFNHDPPLYALVTRFLSDFGRDSSIGFIGQREGWFNMWVARDYFGPPAFAALAGACFGARPDQTITLCVNLFFAFGSSTVFLLLRDTLGYSSKASLLGLLLVGFHPALYYVTLQGFFGQVIGTPLTVMLFWANGKLFDAQQNKADFARYQGLLICFTAGLLLSYPPLLPVAWCITLLYSAILAASRRSMRLVVLSLISHLFAFAVAAALCPARARTFIKFLQLNVKEQAGWFVPFFSPDFFVGLSYQNAPRTFPSPFLHLVWAASATVVGLFLLFITYKKARDTTIACWACCAVVYAGCFVLAVGGGPQGEFGGYKSFKLATYGLTFFVASLTSLLSLRPVAWNSFTVGIKIVAVVAVACGYAWADARLLFALVTTGKRVQPQYQDLVAVDADPKVESVNILGTSGWETMWAAYFLMDKKIYMETQTYYRASALKGAYDLYDSRSQTPPRQLSSGQNLPIRRLNDRLSLIGPSSH